MRDAINLAGRVLIALLFLGGALQKVTDPGPVMQMIGWLWLPGWLVWPLAAFDLVAGIALITGPGARGWGIVMAGYCIFTSWFHWHLYSLNADPWQITIVVKNWAIAGGLLLLAAEGPGRFALGRGWLSRPDPR